MKYLPALAALLSLAACALWIAALAGPWYRTSNPDGTEQHMGLYSSCESGHQHGHGQGYNTLEDAMGVTAFREELAQRQHHKHDQDAEEEDQSDRDQHHHHKHGHKHGQEHEKEQDMEKEESHEKQVSLPTLQPIIIQPTVPPQNINAPTTAAPLPRQPTGPGDLQTGGSGGGGGGFGGWGGAGGGGGGTMRPTPGPTALPAHGAPPPPPGPTPFPASKHGHAYRDRGHHHHDGDDEEDEDEHESFEPMALNQVSAADGATSGSEGPEEDDTRPHEHKRPPANIEDEQHAGGKHQHNKHAEKHGKKHGKKHHQDKQEISGNNEFPYEETWVKALRILLMLAIIVSGIASLLQLLMAWNVGRALHKGSWTTSPTTAMITTALITLAGIHGLIVLFLFLSRRDELPHHGHFDYGYTLNIVATALSLMSPILFWYTLDTSPTESLLGEETSLGGRRKYASVE